MDDKYEEVKKNVSLKGFRPGKVPREVLKRQFGQAIYGEVLDKILKETSTKALDEKKRMEISGSIVDATNPIRDENGFLLSFESPEKQGQSIEEDYQLVRLQVRQNSGTTDRVVKFFGNDIQFTEIFPREKEEEDDGVDIKALEEELNGEIERQGTLNNDLTDAINTLNRKIAEMNNTTSTDQEKKEVKKDMIVQIG